MQPNRESWSGFLTEDNQGGFVRVFKDWPSAAEHIKHHLLTFPESLGWSLLNQEIDEHVDLANQDRCWELGQQLNTEDNWKCPGEFEERLYRLYVNEIVTALRPITQAAKPVAPQRVVVSLGLQGVLVVLDCASSEATVLTAFLPGFGSPAAVERATSFGQAGWRTDRQFDVRRSARNTPRSKPNRIEVFESERFVKWSREEQIYYALFRPAIQFFRSRYVCQHVGSGRTEDYGRLKESLGPISSWSFPSWLERWNRGLAGIAKEKRDGR